MRVNGAPDAYLDHPARGTGSLITFEPGARSNWHTHPLGQTLIVTSGLGWTQCWGGPIEMIRPGDVVTKALPQVACRITA